MYYEPYEKKRGRKRRRRRGGCLGRLIGLLLKLLALALAVCAGLYFLPTSLMMVEKSEGLSPTDGLPGSPYNLLVLGVDTLSEGAQRSDTMMIASVSGGGVKLTSLQRDLMVSIPGHGQAKLNAAFAYGGPELTLRVVNETFGMNLVRYVVVDFTALVKMVDALGGVEVDVTEAEREQINKNVRYSGRVFAPLGYTYEELTVCGGNTHLSGLQALGYARIRKIDSDFVRTSRQRAVISAMLDALKARPWRLASFARAALQGIDTNLSAVELVSLGEKAIVGGVDGALRLPVDGSFTDDGSRLTMTDAQRNIDALYEFLYGDTEK